MTFDEDTEGGRVCDGSLRLHVHRVLGLVREARAFDAQRGRVAAVFDGHSRVVPQLPDTPVKLDHMRRFPFGVNVYGQFKVIP